MQTGTAEIAAAPPSGRATLASLFLLFLKIGSTAFGGFMALISMVQNYAVERKRLLRQEEMLDGISLATVLPGPVAVNVVAYVGYRVAGFRGAVVSAFAVILPAFLLLLGLSFAYFRFGQMPAVSRFFLGLVPAVAAVIIAAAWNMGAKAVRTSREMVIAFLAAGLLLGIGGFWITIIIVAGSGLAGRLFLPRNAPVPGKQPAGTPPPARTEEKRDTGLSRLPAVLAGVLPASPGLLPDPALLLQLSLTFGGMSVLLFGGGYVFIPLIERIVVGSYGWVTGREFIDAVALGQVTPGPILISAAFIGYKVAGPFGAAAATAAIFTPPALLMLLGTRFLDRIKRSGGIHAALAGIRPAVIGMIAAAGVTVARTAPPAWPSAVIFAAALVALFRFRMEAAWIIPAAGVAGLLLH